jgi:hypothetical protein
MKKLLPIFLIIIIGFTIYTQTAKAINFSEVISSLADTLYSLKNVLTAQVTKDTYSSETPPLPPTTTPAMKICSLDSDCRYIAVPKAPTGCCYCGFSENAD